MTLGIPRVIGLLDWGIGGLGFYRALKERHPGVPVLYVSDAGAEPYGRLSRRELRRRLDLVFNYFAGEGVGHLVVACNAASTALMGTTLVECGDGSMLEVVGVIEPAVRSVLRSGGRRVGVIGGAGTIRSGVYRRLLAPHVRIVHQRIAQPLSALIEQGDLESDLLIEEAARIVAPLRNVDTLLLACTHYVAIQPLIQSMLPSVVLVDPVPELLSLTTRKWGRDAWGEGRSRDRFVTTGDPEQMRNAARAAFSVSIGSIDRIILHGSVSSAPCGNAVFRAALPSRR